MSSVKSEKNILWIDDDLRRTEIYAEMFNLEGFKVTLVQDNDTALDYLQKREIRFGLIIQDIVRAPGKCLSNVETNDGRRSGIEFYKHFIRKFAPKTPVIFLSLSFPDNEINYIIKNYECKYVSKPVLPSQLLTIVNSFFEATENIYEESFSKQQLSIIRIDFEEINDQLIKYLASHPDYLFQINPRRFEELVARLLENNGYSVTLTQKTRDGGKDIYALQKSELGDILSIVECKRYFQDKPVGVSVVRSLYAVKIVEHANIGVVMTTSFFTKPAIEFKNSVGSELSLRDYDCLVEWLKKFK